MIDGALQRVVRYTVVDPLFSVDLGRFAAAGSAGVELYSTAANLGAMQDSDNTNRAREREVRNKLQNARTEEERKAARLAIDHDDFETYRLAGRKRFRILPERWR